MPAFRLRLSVLNGRLMKQIVSIFAGVWVCFLAAAVPGAGPQSSPSAAAPPAGPSPAVTTQKSPERALLDRYCVSCHNQRTKTANLTLDLMNPASVVEHGE